MLLARPVHREPLEHQEDSAVSNQKGRPAHQVQMVWPEERERRVWHPSQGQVVWERKEQREEERSRREAWEVRQVHLEAAQVSVQRA